MVVAPATKISRYSSGVGLLKPSRLIDSAAATKNATITLTRLKRSPSQPPRMAPAMPPKFSASRNDRLEPRL
ncbi:hypothetical protein D3C80_1486450 [compost metagenome]